MSTEITTELITIIQVLLRFIYVVIPMFVCYNKHAVNGSCLTENVANNVHVSINWLPK